MPNMARDQWVEELGYRDTHVEASEKLGSSGLDRLIGVKEVSQTQLSGNPSSPGLVSTKSQPLPLD